MAAAKRKVGSKTSKGQKRGRTAKVSKAKVSSSQEPAAKPSDSLNPFRHGGNYWASVEALKALGIGKMHPFSEIVPAVKKAMGDGWKQFAAKEARSDETGKDAEHRVLQNVSVIARKDYGKPLRERGYEVRWDGRGKLAGLFKISS